MTRLDDVTLELVWSLWSELGVPGSQRRHQSVAIDPEPLIAWTPFLAAGEPRLLSLAFDWCVAHAGHVAKARLPGLARKMPERAVAALAAFNGALARQGVGWRPLAAPSDLDRSRTKMALPTERPALVRVRLRGLCGASGRAEVLASLLACPSRGAEVRDLTPAGLTRRSVERVVGDLVGAGLVAADGGERRRVFRLRDHETLERLVHGSSLRWTDWHNALSLPARLFDIAGHADRGAGIMRVEAARSWASLTSLATRLGLEPPPGAADRPDAFAALMAWGTAAVEKL